MKTINKLKCRIAHELDHCSMDTPDGNTSWACSKCGHSWSSIPKPIKMAVFNFFLVIWVLFIIGQAVTDFGWLQ